MSKKLRVFIVIILALIIVGCRSEEEKREEIQDYSNIMFKTLSLLNNQAKYPEQKEFSLSSIMEKKEIIVLKGNNEREWLDGKDSYDIRKEEKKTVFYSPMGLINIEYEYREKGTDNQVILINFKNSKLTYYNKDITEEVCYNLLSYMNKQGNLYGFNVDSMKIEKRDKDGLNDPINLRNICKVYLSELNSQLYIAMTIK